MDFELDRITRKNGAIVNMANVALFVYSLYKTIILGFNSEYQFYTYIPLSLSVISFASVIYYLENLFRTDISHSNSFSTFIGLIPFITGCYMTFFLGIYGIWKIIYGFDTLSLIRSLSFLYIGYKCVYHLWIVTEIQKKYLESQKKDAK